MKAKLALVYFRAGKTDRFDVQCVRLRQVVAEEAELLPPVALGDALPECDGVVFPEIVGEAYRRAEDFQRIDVPILVVTSEFGTFSMWDWEIIGFLRGYGVSILAPYNLEQARLYCRAIAARRELGQAKFLMFQDNPGEGFQPEIFKSFYWWEDQCTRTIEERLGIRIERRSLKKLGERASTYADADALAEWKKWELPTTGGFTDTMAINSAKLYFALRDEIDSDDIVGMGTNCLNESRCCNTTPCLAGNRLFEERGLLWCCEGDTVSLATMLLLHRTLRRPLIMSNIYPFLMGLAATKHEKIPGFPEILDNPDDHLLMGHCGYFGYVPRPFAEQGKWAVRPRALAIVDQNAHVIDARMRTGPVTLVKLDASIRKIMVSKGRLRGYVQYDQSSDCRNGGVIQLEDGKRFLDNVYSHHLLLVEGDCSDEVAALGRIMDLAVERF